MLDTLRIELEDPHSPTSTRLIASLSSELALMYPEEGNGDGAFKPDDVRVPRGAFVVARAGDLPVGCGALRPMADVRIGEIKRMYVVPEMRGRGISRYVLTTLEKLAREFDYHALRLETGVRQPQAIGLYESAGFTRIECYGDYAHNHNLLSVCYEKPLG